jgi:DNA (cytosine-5)-methyltransferase 1
MSYKTIDLFCGAGGFSLGLHRLKDENGDSLFETVWANDYNKDAVDTFNKNFGNVCLLGDLTEIVDDESIKIPNADLVIGGPPCQGFSLLNKNRVGDPRRELWYQFMRVVEISNASVFVMENVPQLLNSRQYLDIVKHAESLGFIVTPGQTLVAADYGVPQVRKRAIIIGSKVGNPHNVFPPKATHRNPKKDDIDLPVWNTVRSVIEDLPPPVGTELRDDESDTLRLHFGRNPTQKSKDRYRAIPDEGMNRFDLQRIAPALTPACWIRKKSGGTDLFGRLWWDRPSVTIRTEFFKPEKGRYLHPVQHRPITHREAARIQSFPDSFYFCGSKIEIARQIGNAVPPMLAEKIGLSVISLFENKSQVYSSSDQFSLCLEP